MTYTPANITPADPIYISPFSRNSLQGAWYGSLLGAPSSGALIANRILYSPFYLGRSYSLARWFWCDGATVGTDYLQVGIYDENLNLLKASPRTLSAGTINQVQYANPGIHGTNVIPNNTSSVDGTQFTLASATLKAGVLYLLAVENSAAASAGAISSIDSATGGYPTFTSRSTVQYNASLNRISIWSAVPTADFTGALRINYGATQTGAVWGLNAFYHVDTATTDGVVQNATGTGSSVTPLATLAAFGSANNATFGAFGNLAAATTASTGYLELDDFSTTVPTQGMATVYRPDNDTTVDCTLGVSQAWGACAVEIKSLGTGAVALRPMRGYLALHCSGATATIFRRSASEAIRVIQYIQSSATSGLPPSATLATSTTSTMLPVAGFTSRSSP